MSEITFEMKCVGELIKSKLLKVPRYQRPYSWVDKQVDDILEDIDNAIKVNADEYFLGTIVLSKIEMDNKLEIVDGQQRITTIAIFFAVMINLLQNDEAKNSLKTEYLTSYIQRTEKHIPRLELNLQDNEFYISYVIKENKDVKPTKESHNRIINTKEKVSEKLNSLLKNANNDFNIIYDWQDFIDTRLKVIVITVPSEANAFTIFETLNDRGLELAQIDLLKNYLYSKASATRLDEAQNLWVEITSTIESIASESILLTYIKHQWAYTHGFVREKNKELYNQIKNSIRNSTQVIKYLTDLKNDLEKYHAIMNPNSQFWEDYDSKCKEYIQTLNYFNLEQYRPLILSILNKFSKDEVKKSIKLIVSWLVRNLIIGKLGGGSLEQAYVEKAYEISLGKISKASELRDSLRKLVPGDDEFTEGFKIAKVSKQKLARYYLSAIENYYRDKDYPELLVNSNTDAVNLEHILPKKPDKKKWSNFTEEDHESYLNRIGNLTLMKSRENSKFKSDGFNIKKNKYKNSGFWITNMLNKYSQWTKENIEDRQSKLAELAKNTWSIKFD